MLVKVFGNIIVSEGAETLGSTKSAGNSVYRFYHDAIRVISMVLLLGIAVSKMGFVLTILSLIKGG